MQGPLSSDLGFESVRNNAELSRTLLRQIIRNVEKSHDFPPRSNRADSKENYHLQASYIPRLGWSKTKFSMQRMYCDEYYKFYLI